MAGQHEEAWLRAHQALDLSRQLKARGGEALALHQIGLLHAHGTRLDAGQAEAYYRHAFVLAEELGMRPLQAHGHLGLGILYATTDRPEPARVEISTAIEMYRTMAMTFWLPQAVAALAKLESHEA
jgi:hypothetical protein